MVRLAECIVLCVIADTALCMINNTQIEARNQLAGQQAGQQAARRNSKKAKHKSTSSSDNHDTNESGDQSLDLTESSGSSSGSKVKKDNDGRPKSSLERKGWRKWHRKCTPCHEDMLKKWRDPSIKWICGAFQRARRSFKSLCMMHYRNCQDGTMFTKVHDRRCANSSSVSPHGDHFFYDYRVVLTDDDSDSKTVSDSTDAQESSDEY